MPHSVSQQTGAIGHLSVLREEHPIGVPFLFEDSQRRLGSAVGLSLASHVAIFSLAVFIMRYAPVAQTSAVVKERPTRDIVWVSVPGPGGGGGGGGNRTPEPPKQAELPGKAKLTVPVVKLPSLEQTPKQEPPPETQLNIPAKTLASSEQTLPGALEGASASASLGPGSGGGAGTGTGTGIGPGQGSGLGPGFGGGTGGGAYRPGSGVELPRVLREVKPQYTPDAMRAKVQGTVWLECIVEVDGTVGQVQVVRSLDPTFGLDQEAVRAAKQWRFIPGMLKGQPVPVVITIELTFTLR